MGFFSLLTCQYDIFCLESINLVRRGVILLLTCWIGQKLDFSNSKCTAYRFYSLLTCWYGIFYSVLYILILSCFYETWEKGWCDFAVDLLNWEEFFFAHSKRLYEGFFLWWLVDMVYCVLHIWVLREGVVWFCCWLVELRRNSFSATQKKVYRVCLFLCWLVDMVYSVLYLWVLREGVVWFYCWLVELSKTLASATQKNCI